MPELVEVELYRRLAERAVGAPVTEVRAPDPWFLKGGLDAAEVARRLRGTRIAGARRRGKLLLLDTAGRAGRPGPVVGLRFGMTGRLLLDDQCGVGPLLHTSGRTDPAWDRFGLVLGRRGVLRVNDPRRLGGVELDPSEASLGPDGLDVTPAQLRAALQRSQTALKARLLDQSRVAGVGNLAADELLWRARLDPRRPAGGLSGAEHRRLHAALTGTLRDLLERGGSHLGPLREARRPGGACPRDGTPLQRDTVGGRTTWWCRRCQR